MDQKHQLDYNILKAILKEKSDYWVNKMSKSSFWQISWNMILFSVEDNPIILKQIYRSGGYKPRRTSSHDKETSLHQQSRALATQTKVAH